MFIFYFVYTKHQVLLICNEHKEIYVANLMIHYRFISSWEYIFWGFRSEWVKGKPMEVYYVAERFVITSYAAGLLRPAIF